jgi:hypothetical protein
MEGIIVEGLEQVLEQIEELLTLPLGVGNDGIHVVNDWRKLGGESPIERPKHIRLCE